MRKFLHLTTKENIRMYVNTNRILNLMKMDLKFSILSYNETVSQNLISKKAPTTKFSTNKNYPKDAQA